MMEKFGAICLKRLPSLSDLYLDMALEMINVIEDCHARGKAPVLIVPVGPTEQYPIFAKLVNQKRLNLGDVQIFNMDEYLLDPETVIPESHPMSFHGRMQRELYDNLDPALTIPPENRHFPTPGHEKEYDELLASLGGADACFGGLGINGHIAFNEAPERDVKITAAEFAALPTRVLPITRETRTVNAIGYQRGDIYGMPEYCITVGMAQLLAAGKIYIALNRPWQHGIARRVLRGEVTPYIPASLLQTHGDVTFAAESAVAEGF